MTNGKGSARRDDLKKFQDGAYWKRKELEEMRKDCKVLKCIDCSFLSKSYCRGFYSYPKDWTDEDITRMVEEEIND